jgi:hypothetical protein
MLLNSKTKFLIDLYPNIYIIFEQIEEYQLEGKFNWNTEFKDTNVTAVISGFCKQGRANGLWLFKDPYGKVIHSIVFKNNNFLMKGSKRKGY